MRCGTITHGFNSDQRYVGCVFTQNGDTTADHRTAQRQHRAAGPLHALGRRRQRPAVRGPPFVRLSSQQLILYTDRSTFSVHEITVLGTPATFNYAFYLVLDGALPAEVGTPIPDPEIGFISRTAMRSRT